MSMNKKVGALVIGSLSLLLVVFTVRAMVFDPATWIYRFHLYYDQGKLVVNRDTAGAYDMDSGPYLPKTESPSQKYRTILTSPQGKLLFELKFDPQNGDPSFKQGVFDLETPYFGDAQSANFYNETGKLLLKIDLSNTLVCDDNGVCDANLEEDQLSCPSDCGVVTPTPTNSLTPLPSATPPPSSGSNNWLLFVVPVLVVAGLVVWFIIRNRRKKVPIS